MDERRRGLVIDVADDFVVVLSTDGAFARVSRRALDGPVEVGGEVVLPGGRSWRTVRWPRLAAPRFVALPGRRRWAAAAAATLLAVTFSGLSYWQGQHAVYAHVSVDLPSGVSADLAVNANGRVLKAVFHGGNLARPSEAPSIAGRDLTEAVQVLVHPAIDRTDSEATVVIALAPVARGSDDLPSGLRKKFAESRDTVRALLPNHGADDPAVVSMALSASASEMAALQAGASELGLSLGQYLLYLEATKAGVPVDLAKAREDGVAKAIHDAGVPPGQVFKAASEEKDFVELFREHGKHGQKARGAGQADGHGGSSGDNHGGSSGDNHGGSGGDGHGGGQPDGHGTGQGDGQGRSDGHGDSGGHGKSRGDGGGDGHSDGHGGESDH